MTANTGLARCQQYGTTTVLTTLLADQFILSLKALKNHWNVVEPTFNDLHGFLWRHHASLNAMMDFVAKRIRAVGSNAPGTMIEFLDATELREAPGIYPSAEAMLAELLKDHDTVIRRLRDDVKRCSELFNDPGTAELLGVMLRRHEYLAGVLRSLLTQYKTAARSATMSESRSKNDAAVFIIKGPWNG
jgi:starvation-inducible DNA-binding protein